MPDCNSIPIMPDCNSIPIMPDCNSIPIMPDCNSIPIGGAYTRLRGKLCSEQIRGLEGSNPNHEGTGRVPGKNNRGRMMTLSRQPPFSRHGFSRQPPFSRHGFSRQAPGTSRAFPIAFFVVFFASTFSFLCCRKSCSQNEP
jgi:hypothetical protein